MKRKYMDEFKRKSRLAIIKLLRLCFCKKQSGLFYLTLAFTLDE